MEDNLRLSVVSDSDGVRTIFPMLTTAKRTMLAKLLKEKLQEACIHVRKNRQEEMEGLSDMSEDEAKRAKDDIQKCVDEANQSLEAVFAKKETEVMN